MVSDYSRLWPSRRNQQRHLDQRLHRSQRLYRDQQLYLRYICRLSLAES